MPRRPNDAARLSRPRPKPASPNSSNAIWNLGRRFRLLLRKIQIVARLYRRASSRNQRRLRRRSRKHPLLPALTITIGRPARLKARRVRKFPDRRATLKSEMFRGPRTRRRRPCSGRCSRLHRVIRRQFRHRRPRRVMNGRPHFQRLRVTCSPLRRQRSRPMLLRRRVTRLRHQPRHPRLTPNQAHRPGPTPGAQRVAISNQPFRKRTPKTALE